MTIYRIRLTSIPELVRYFCECCLAAARGVLGFHKSEEHKK
jgi:hypothetical protein